MNYNQLLQESWVVLSLQRYVVTLAVEKHVLVMARDEDHAKSRAVAIERNGQEDTKVTAVAVSDSSK